MARFNVTLVLRTPGQAGRPFRRMAATHSEGMAATCSDRMPATFWPIVGIGGRHVGMTGRHVSESV